MSHCASKPLMQAQLDTMDTVPVPWQSLPGPSLECSRQKVPPHPVPPARLSAALSLEQRLFQLCQRSLWPALRAGGMHPCRGMLYRAPACPILQPAPLPDCSLGRAVQVNPHSYCRENL